MQLIQQEGKGIRGVFHCFSGSWEMAKELLKKDFYLSFGGPLTFNKAAKLQDIAQKAPLDRILLETDSPYLTPHPLRGKRNEPANVKLVAEVLADLRGITVDEVAAATNRNVETLFGISVPVL